MNDKTAQTMTDELRAMATSNSDLYEYERLQLKDAAGTIDALIAENDRLTACLEKANISTEHFEREWYLRGDELDTLRDQLAEVRKDAELERALRQAAKDLPAHFFISVNVERDAGWVELYGSAGGSIEIAQEDRTLAEQVRAAIDAAKGPA